MTNFTQLKIINKHKRDASEEVDILLRHSHHPNIVRLCAVYEDENSVYLFQELCRGGELLERIIAQKHFSEREAAAVMDKLANVLAYLHSNQVYSVFLCLIKEGISGRPS